MYVYPHTRIQSLVSILRTTVHHAFPVVTENRAYEREFMKWDQLISNNIKFKVRPARRTERESRAGGTSSFVPGFWFCSVLGQQSPSALDSRGGHGGSLSWL